MSRNTRGLLPGSPLSERQTETLYLLADGETPSSIAEIMGITRNTVDAFVAQLRHKLYAKTNSQAIAYAYHVGLLKVPKIIMGVRQEPTWVFTCPIKTCHLYEAGFQDEEDADAALRQHIDERHGQ